MHSSVVPARRPSPNLQWIRVAPAAPYFLTEEGDPWTPIGHNDAITWEHLRMLPDDGHVAKRYFETLQAHGVTCLRLMLEYAQRATHYFEDPVGHVPPRMLQTWDALFELAEQHGIRFLLTPFDTFWMWKRWARHPYNVRQGGPCATPRTLLTSAPARAVIKQRLALAIDRWGGSGALFAWDLWNEIHPAYADDDPGRFDDFISEVAAFVRDRELARYGRRHPITVSAFGPILVEGFWSRELGPTMPDPRAAASVYRHPLLDFASVHTYAEGTIDHPRNTVDPALAMADLTRKALAEITDGRPFFDSEHGPIHTFKDTRRVLPPVFDDEYFRHLQWAHLASGGAGGGMRWPNRRPHVLTPGMHAAQAGLARFTALIDWTRFDRRNVTPEITLSSDSYAACGCGSDTQVIVWLVRKGGLTRDRRLRPRPATLVHVTIPGLRAGRYRATEWNTERGEVAGVTDVIATGPALRVPVHVDRDLAIAVTSVSSHAHA